MQGEITKTKDFRNRKFCLSVFKYHGTLVLWVVLLGCTRALHPSFNSFSVKEGGEAAPEMYHPKYRMYHSTITSWQHLDEISRFGNISCLIILFIDYHIIYTQWRTAGENMMQREITRTEDFRNREFCLSVFKYHGTLVLWLVLLGCTRVQRPSFNSFSVKEGGKLHPRCTIQSTECTIVPYIVTV